jgi:hypothetical protein
MVTRVLLAFMGIFFTPSPMEISAYKDLPVQTVTISTSKRITVFIAVRAIFMHNLTEALALNLARVAMFFSNKI